MSKREGEEEDTSNTSNKKRKVLDYWG